MPRYQLIRQSISWGLPLLAVCLLSIGTAAQGRKETLQTVPLNETMGSPDLATGAVRLTRARNEIWASLHVTELAPNSPFTIWAAVFNEPEACTTNPGGPIHCSVTDLMAMPNFAKASAFNVGAFLTDGIGVANADVNIRTGIPPAGAFILFGQEGLMDNGVSPGLHEGNGFGAEVHLIVRSHGPIIAVDIAAQLSLFNGGCPPNACANVQVAQFARVVP